MSIRRPSAVAVAIIGAGTLFAYALLAAVQILVWNPLAAVPGAGLAQIYSEVAAAGESMGAGRVIAFLAVGPLAALALLAPRNDPLLERGARTSGSRCRRSLVRCRCRAMLDAIARGVEFCWQRGR
jgi:hypothetical protein